MIIDPGVGINHISEKFCKRAQVHTKPAPYKVQLANKSTENMYFARNKVTVSIESYSESFRMASNPLSYDVILGKKWCVAHKATVDCARNIFKMVYRHKKLNIRALASTDSEISINAVRLRDKTAEVFTIDL